MNLKKIFRKIFQKIFRDFLLVKLSFLIFTTILLLEELIDFLVEKPTHTTAEKVSLGKYRFGSLFIEMLVNR